MEEQDGEEMIRRGWLRWLGVGTGTLALVLVGLWTQRAPIAENFVSRELNRRGVRANYDLVDVGLRTQRIEDIVLGDPARPDLTADWVEVDIAFTGVTPEVAAVRAGGVRLHGSYKGGVLKLGELDKFSDPSSTAPFSLPDILLSLADARLRLDTDAGQVGLRIDGNGGLQSGFAGKVAAVMPRGTMAGCAMTDGSALLDIAMREGQPHMTGPIRAAAFACREAATAMARPVAVIDLTLGKAFERWTGHVDLSGEALKSNGLVLASPTGRIDFDGSKAGSQGRARIGAASLAGGGTMIEQAALTGAWTVKSDEATVQGNLSGRNIRLASRASLAAFRESTAGTPVAPLAARLVDAVAMAGESNQLGTDFALVQRGAKGSLVLTGSRLAARSGAQAALSPDGRVTLGWPGPGRAALDWALDGALTTRGGGLPQAALRLVRRPGGGFGGDLFIDPYAAGDARMALDRVRFTAEANGTTRFATSLRLDGPLPDGHLRGLTLPIEGQLAADGALRINPRCVPLSVTEARYGSFAVGQTRQTLCPLDGGALFAMGPGGIRGGADIRKLALSGTSGDSPMRLTADHARIALGQTGFTLANADLSIGPQDAPVRLAAAKLDGRMTAKGFSGKASGAGGRIGTIPLILEQGNGDWSFTNGALAFRAAMTVRDSQVPARFIPLAVPDFTLTMQNSRITATGTLTAPRNGATVARTDIVHNLNTGKGHADLTVPGLAFGPDLQPEDVTPLALGVVANVKAEVTGTGRIDWTGSDVTSTGTFRTQDANLAAAFGPVEGLSGELRFTDLINLVSAPGQEARIKSVNPGIEARDGIVRYRLEAGQKVRIEGGGWPFSGGELVLLPTTMDFSADVDRYMTFRVIGLDAGAFIQAMELDNISATGTFDGLMPLIFNAQGGRVAGGVLVARQEGMPPLLMPEGVLPSIPCDSGRQSGVLSYVGPVSNEQLGTMGRIAFDALKNLQYKCLTILMDGALDGEMVTNVVFNGVNRGQLGGAPAGLARNFVGLPFLFNVRISAPFRGLMSTAQSVIDPTQTIRDEIGRQAQEKMRAQAVEGLAVQPVDSDKMANGEPK
ncbi:intermembrane phospholipid transport protein YdbH family protein [Sphingobium sp. Ant17]|uniref:intermembrane phospholipid transport protein YdbH family protein n=1 Tax=Sphingobium sp. Ant17 TaxID=1461752 RepID=UPI00044645E2|nr:YdbH domain-containing protein [Sphingobium sp. Ant17]EXS70198.1 exoprotein [Sphingobium sp. Ant17]